MEFSVLMAVYAGDSPVYFNEALESVCNEQTLTPSEVILVVDGTVGQDLQDIISFWQTNSSGKFIVLHLAKNRGLAFALNFGLSHCSFDLVARMDADDIALPNRFAVQMDFMVQNPSIACCSSSVEIFDETGKSSARILPLDHNAILKYAKMRNPVNHPSVVFRKNIILECGGYPEFRTSQDYALWSVMLLAGYKFANVDATLVRMRAGEALLKRRSFKYLLGELKVIYFQYTIGFLTKGELIRNVVIRASVRLSPILIKRFLYNILSK